jgi:hypothetical protein
LYIYYSYFPDCGQLGTVLLQTARVTLKFSAISQSLGMMVLHLGVSLNLWQLVVNTRRQVLATRLLVSKHEQFARIVLQYA